MKKRNDTAIFHQALSRRIMAAADEFHGRKNGSVVCDGSPEHCGTVTRNSAIEQGMNLKAHMHGSLTLERCARMDSGKRPFHGHLSVCLCIVVLAVCGWVMHRRLSQYDAPQQAVHQSTSIKACVTKRNPISVPSMRGTDAFAVFLLALAFTALLNAPGNPEAALGLRVLHEKLNQRPDAGVRASLDHFFFLPPPSRSSVL